VSREFERFLMWVISYAVAMGTAAAFASLRRMWRMEAEFRIIQRNLLAKADDATRINRGLDRLAPDVRNIKN
jgi:hypothetical protein